MNTRRLYTEGVWSYLLKMFSFQRMRQEIQALEELELTPEIQAQLSKLKSDGDTLEARLIAFCKEHPEEEICQDRENQSKLTGVYK